MQITNQTGLRISFLKNGNIKNIDSEPIRINLKPGTPFSKSTTNIYLRKHAETITYIPLLGPESVGEYTIIDNIYIASGSWEDIDFKCELSLAENSQSWLWSVKLINNTSTKAKFDLVYSQDVGLKQITDNLINEYYVSQYLERTVLHDESYGKVICCRQNMKESTGYPWLMITSINGAISGCTDGWQFWGNESRETGFPKALLQDLLSGNYAGESPIIALQEKPFILEPGKEHQSKFLGTYLPNHPEAISTKDTLMIPELFSAFESKPKINNSYSLSKPETNRFTSSSFFPSEDLSAEDLADLFGNDFRHKEYQNDTLLSFFYGKSNHVALKQKELLVDRPHGHIIQAKAGFVPDENIVSTSCFAFGVFNSHLCQGNTNFNVLLSTCTNPYNLTLEAGQRIFVRFNNKLYLLGIPSAFEIGLNYCRWIYKYGHTTIQVRTWSSKTENRINMDLTVLTGNNLDFIITHDFDKLNAWNLTKSSQDGEFVIKPASESMISSKFPNAQYRICMNSDIVVLETDQQELLYENGTNTLDSRIFQLHVPKTSSFSISFLGEVCNSSNFTKIKDSNRQFEIDLFQAEAHWDHLSQNLQLYSEHPDIRAIIEILPWYGMNALTHFLTPYGLEQFSGAAWGTRDVSQGPIDLLLTLEKYEETKTVLCSIFSHQNPDGGWPQWWMFDSYHQIRASDSHGDVYYWVIIALSEYIKQTGDYTILEIDLPFYHADGIEFAESASINEHLSRLITMITASFIPGTALVPFGGGDWNDSLQPVSSELAKRLISSWTVEMNYQAFCELSKIYAHTNPEKAEELISICNQIKSDFNTHLIKDGIVAGYGLVEHNNTISVLLHPSDNTTGISYSILPMNRGIISGIFTKQQADFHQNLIEKKLKGPDGARLMDKPLKYKGGLQQIFQRAESSTFFGREIGLMYIHEHIRYAESLARMGKADAFLFALRQAIPVGYKNIVPNSDYRQSNCYYSSSDVAFNTRYEADEKYNDIVEGYMLLKGGWRVYSSGPGIYVSMIISRLLGIRKENNLIIIDPVLPTSLNNLSVNFTFLNQRITVIYNISQNNFSPYKIEINEKEISFKLQNNPYRSGGATVTSDEFLSYLTLSKNVIKIYL